jgi:hypothetical protein
MVAPICAYRAPPFVTRSKHAPSRLKKLQANR